MELILWRHADAEAGAVDLERRLTPQGRKQAERVARWLREHLPEDARVIASPAARARETAQALAAKPETDKRLAPGASVPAILKVAGWPESEDAAVVLVGHQPDFGRAAAFLVSGTQADWSVKKAGLWWLSNRVRDETAQVVVRAVTGPDFV